MILKYISKWIVKYKKYLIFVIVILMIIIGFIINNILDKSVVKNENNNYNSEKGYSVILKGEVVNPNTYYLEREIYLFELIDLAGGFTKYSDTSNLNLIDKIEGDCEIEILKTNEINDNAIVFVEYCQTDSFSYLYIENTMCIYKFSKSFTFNEIVWMLNLDNSKYKLDLGKCITEDTFLKEKNALLNINNASYKDLLDLGFLNANVINNILNYIDLNGSIDTVEELDSISGIGNKTLEKLLVLICFN